jgi:hypothetical protein
MSKSPKPVLLCVLAFLLGALFVAGGTLLVVRPTYRVVAAWKENGGYKYNGCSSYTLTVLEGGLDISHVPYNVDRLYYICVSANEGKPVYGHLVNFSFYADDPNDVDAYIKKSSVVWSEDGVTFQDASGQKLFIPGNLLHAR